MFEVLSYVFFKFIMSYVEYLIIYLKRKKKKSFKITRFLNQNWYKYLQGSRPETGTFYGFGSYRPHNIPKKIDYRKNSIRKTF